MQTDVEMITPNKAEQILRLHNKLNRNLRQRIVKKYAKDMLDGNWQLTHQGIAFYFNGTLADGQHRLAAIVLSGVDIQMSVTRGLPLESGKGVDIHAQRALQDVLRIGGAPPWINQAAVAVARALLSKFDKIKDTPSASTIEDYLLANEDAVKFGLSLVSTKRRGVTSACLTACYVCAYSAGEDSDRIAKFAEIMVSGMADGPGDSAAIRLREQLINNTAAWAGGLERHDSSKKAQRAIHAFVRHQSLGKLQAQEKLIYPTP